MELIESKHCFLFKDFFLPAVTAGFTTKAIEGNLPQDIEKIPIFKKGGFNLSYLKQIHSSRIHSVKSEGVYEGDGLFTKKDGLVLVVRTADCLPLFFCSDKEDVIGLIHMGWRGAKEGILEGIDFDLSSFRVAAGTGLRKSCYEVGDEFLEYSGFKDHVEKRKDKLYFDPIGFVKDALLRKGLRAENFFDVDICSLCSKNFFSYRRDKTDLRTLSFIVKR